MNYYPQAQIDAVEAVARKLMYPNNTVTTLEIKLELRKPPYNTYAWVQPVVSEIMMELEQQGKFDYKDNGTYRIYSLAGSIPKTAQNQLSKNVKKAKVKRTRISATTTPSLASLVISTAGGRFLTIVDKQNQKYNCQFVNKFNLGNDDFGINIKLLKTGKAKTVALSQIKNLSIDNIDYQVQ